MVKKSILKLSRFIDHNIEKSKRLKNNQIDKRVSIEMGIVFLIGFKSFFSISVIMFENIN